MPCCVWEVQAKSRVGLLSAKGSDAQQYLPGLGKLYACHSMVKWARGVVLEGTCGQNCSVSFAMSCHVTAWLLPQHGAAQICQAIVAMLWYSPLSFSFVQRFLLVHFLSTGPSTKAMAQGSILDLGCQIWFPTLPKPVQSAAFPCLQHHTCDAGRPAVRG